MKKPTPKTPKVNTESENQARGSSLYTQIIDKPTNDNPRGYENRTQPHQTHNAIHNSSLKDKKAFALKLTCIWIGQIWCQLGICFLIVYFKETAELFFDYTNERRTILFYCTILMFIVCLILSQIITKHRKPGFTYTLLILTTLSTGLVQGGLLFPLHFNVIFYDCIICIYTLVWEVFGFFWGIISIIGNFSLISITIYLRKEEYKLNISAACKYMYIIPICIAIIAVLGFLSQGHVAISLFVQIILVLGLGGSIYGAYYLKLVIRILDLGKDNFDRTECIQAGLILNRNMLFPCFA